jgi:hypothetical protein
MVNLRRVMFFLFLQIFFHSADSVFASTEVLQTHEVVIIFQEPLGNAAREVLTIYPSARAELSDTLGWQVDFRPEVVLVGERDKFRKITGSDLIVAIASPQRNLIVLDVSRVYTRPFTLKTVLKHELCHLLLHRNIESDRLYRWFDEGVCQWASGGVSELTAGEEGRALATAVRTNGIISIRALEKFPMDEHALMLSYEESKSIVEYIHSEFGSRGILQMLEHLKKGGTMDDSIRESLAVSPSELERDWHAYLRRRYTWFSYLSHNLYTILFLLGALITIYGFVRFLKKKRDYKDEQEEEDTE